MDTKGFENIKTEIQELHERKKVIEDRARKNSKTPELMPLPPENKGKIKTLKKLLKRRISMDQKKDLLRIRIQDLKLHFGKNKLAMEVIEQAEYVTGAKSWKFSSDAECCWCGERFFDVKLTEHLRSVHLGTTSDEPKFVSDSLWVTIESAKWKPVNVVEAKKKMEDLSRNKGGEKDFMKQEWPCCEDSGREEIIKRILSLLTLFLRIHCFCSSHLSALMNMILGMLKQQVPEKLLMKFGINQNPLSVCFLDVSELNLVLKFLEDLADCCSFRKLYWTLAIEKTKDEPSVPNYEKIVFNEDFSFVVFDKRMLCGELMLPNDGAAVTSSADDEIKLNDDEYKDAFSDWLLKGATNIKVQLKQWKDLRKTSGSEGKELFKIYEAEFHRLQNICEKKVQYLRDIKVWQNLESICVEEDKRREEPGYESLSYKYLLSNQKQIANTNGNIFELDILGNILRADPVDNKIKLEIEKQIGEMTAKLCKLDVIIQTTIINIQWTKKKINAVIDYDYRSILVPLLKSFMQAQLEDLAN